MKYIIQPILYNNTRLRLTRRVLSQINQISVLGNLLSKNSIFESFGSSWLAWAVNLIQAIYKSLLWRDHNHLEHLISWNKVIETQKRFADTVHDGMVNIYLLGNVVAGNDTTTTAICSVIYYVPPNPPAY